MKAGWLFLALLVTSGHALDLSGYLSSEGGFKAEVQATAPSLSGTVMALRTLRYSGAEVGEPQRVREFVLSCFDPAAAAFREPGGDSRPTVLANAFALMAMAELEMAEDIHAVSARDFLVSHAATFDEIYMAMAGLSVMGLADEIPASWIKNMMDAALADDVPPYDKARAIITCMRTGFNLPDYARFREPLETALGELVAVAAFHSNPEMLQQAYALARALVMIDGRVSYDVPSAREIAGDPPLGTLYRLAVLDAWEGKLAGKLTVAICTGFAPVGFRDPAGRVAGMDADLMRAFAREHGYELVFVEQTRFDGIWRLPARGECDIAASGLSKRRDRLVAGIRWSYPYFSVERSLSILKTNADRFRNIADFDGMKIAVTAGTTGDQDIRQRNPNAIRVPYDDEATAIRDLLAGKVHALARGDVSNRYDARVHPELTVIDVHPMDPVEEFVMAVARDRVALGQKLDHFLRESRRQGRLEEIFRPYLEE